MTVNEWVASFWTVLDVRSKTLHDYKRHLAPCREFQVLTEGLTSRGLEAKAHFVRTGSKSSRRESCKKAGH